MTDAEPDWKKRAAGMAGMYNAVRVEDDNLRAHREAQITALRKIHAAFNVAVHRIGSIRGRLPACAGADCVICRAVEAELDALSVHPTSKATALRQLQKFALWVLDGYRTGGWAY